MLDLETSLSVSAFTDAKNRATKKISTIKICLDFYFAVMSALLKLQALEYFKAFILNIITYQ